MTDKPIALLLTRPLAQSQRFVRALARRGAHAFQPSAVQICISPLFEIIFQGALPDITPYRSLIFTSSNAVRAFSRLAPDCVIPSFTVGQATADTAVGFGLPAQMLGVDVQDFAKALLVFGPETPCLHLRGDLIRRKLAPELTQAGVTTDEAIVYRQNGVPLNSTARQILRGAAPVIIPLFSPRTAQRFRAEYAKAGGTAPIYVVALAPAIAAEMSDVNMANLVVAEHPNATAMENAINSVFETLMHLERRARTP